MDIKIIYVFAKNKKKKSGFPVSVFMNEFPVSAKGVAAAPLKTRQSADEILSDTAADTVSVLITPSNVADFSAYFKVGSRRVLYSVSGALAAVKSLADDGKLNADKITIELENGAVVAVATDEESHFYAEQGSPLYEEPAMEQFMPLLMALGLSMNELDPSQMPMVVASANRVLVLPISSEDALLNVAVNLSALEVVTTEMGVDGVYLFAPSTEKTATHRGRLFVPSLGEKMGADTVSGTFTASLGCYLYDILGADEEEFSISVGADVEALLKVKLDTEDRRFFGPRVGGLLVSG